MKVLEAQARGTVRSSWLVVDDEYRPIKPIIDYLKYREQDLSPNTVKQEAYRLKRFWEYLKTYDYNWGQIRRRELSGYIHWLQDPPREPLLLVEYCPFTVGEGDPCQKPSRSRKVPSPATIDLYLTTIHEFYSYHESIGTVPNLGLYEFVQMPYSSYKPLLYGIARARRQRRRRVRLRHARRHLPDVLTQEEVQTLLDACTNRRDKLLIAMMYDTGMRIGQVLGLRHEDVKVEDLTIAIVPREDNVNGARAKKDVPYAIFASEDLMALYTKYLIDDILMQDWSHIPDYVFVNLYGGEKGHPLMYSAVMSLVRRLKKKTGIDFHPHIFRHTCATELLSDPSTAVSTVSRQLGHNSQQTTEHIYGHISLKEAHRRMANAQAKRKGWTA